MIDFSWDWNGGQGALILLSSAKLSSLPSLRDTKMAVLEEEN